MNGSSINASLSTIKISEIYSNNYSIAIGINLPSDGNNYNMVLNETVLSNLYCSNLIFNSFNGSIFITGITQSTNMNGVSSGKISFITSQNNGSYQYITIDDNPSNTNGIEFISYNGIYVNKNITNENGTILFSFFNNNMYISSSFITLFIIIIKYN